MITLDWDLNGNLKEGITNSMIWNWDNKLRHGQVGSDSVNCVYTPDGAMVAKQTTQASQTTRHKYIVDTVGNYPVILLVLDADDFSILKSYIHANGQVLMQYDGDPATADKYFYLHDRLGSVRLLIDTSANVVNMYTYDPFGNPFPTEVEESIDNLYRFAGYKWDPVTGMYPCNARWYDPALYRFTARDPVLGSFREPLTLHAYLYCANDPVNYVDPAGKWAITLGGSISGNITSMNFSSLGTNVPYSNMIGSSIGKIMGYHFFVLPYMVNFAEHFGVGGTAGAGLAVAKDSSKAWDEGWSWGSIGWLAGGASYSSGAGGSLTLDIGYSPQAQHVNDLAGRFVEAGGSVGFYVPPSIGGIFNNAVIGGSVSWGIDAYGNYNGINLYTGSFGTGTSGWEVHSYVGRTWVSEW